MGLGGYIGPDIGPVRDAKVGNGFVGKDLWCNDHLVLHGECVALISEEWKGQVCCEE